MKSIREKIAYLQGLSKGLDVDESSKEGQVLSGIIDVLGDMVDQLDDIETAQDDLEEYVESIDEDLDDLESNFFGDDDLEMEDMVEVECPKCHEIVCFESDIVDDEDLIEVTCPNCDEVVYVNDEEMVNTNDNAVLEAKEDEDF